MREGPPDSAAAARSTPASETRGEVENGGFPSPPPGATVRVWSSHHAACGTETRIRLPAPLPPAAIRSAVCASCGKRFEPSSVDEIEETRVERAEAHPATFTAPAPSAAMAGTSGGHLPLPPLPSPRLPSMPSLRLPSGRSPVPAWARDPRSSRFRAAGLVLAAIAVLGALALIQGGDESTTPFEATQPAAEAPPSGPGGGARSDAADFVRQSSFSLALPAGWRRTGTARGATFTAAASDGEADVALWVERDPGLDFAAFETRSLEQLRALAGSAQVTERVAAPTVEGTIVRLAADNPPGSPRYEVTLRASGPYRYYLATTVQPGASRSAVEGAELIHGSFVPAGAGGKGG